MKTKINIYVIKGLFKSSFFFRGQDSLIKSDAFSPIIIFFFFLNKGNNN